jgi:phosphate/sulfate permease
MASTGSSLTEASLSVLLAELTSLRAEIAEHQRARLQCFSLALTATAAVGAFALGGKGNEQALLALPLVLSGLGITHLRHCVDMDFITEYIRTELEPRLRAVWTHMVGEVGLDVALPSWDAWIQEQRRQHRIVSGYNSLSFLPPMLIFGFPGIAAEAITLNDLDEASLVIAWGLGAVGLAVTLGLTIWSTRHSPRWTTTVADHAAAQ